MTRGSSSGSDEDRVRETLNQADGPLSHEEISERLGIDPNEAGEIASDLVIRNEASITAKREYRSLE